MDRTARILGVWIVGCMIVGGALVIANVPINQPWTDQNLWLVRLGLVVIGLGVLGIVAEILGGWCETGLLNGPASRAAGPGVRIGGFRRVPPGWPPEDR